MAPKEAPQNSLAMDKSVSVEHAGAHRLPAPVQQLLSLLSQALAAFPNSQHGHKSNPCKQRDAAQEVCAQHAAESGASHGDRLELTLLGTPMQQHGAFHQLSHKPLQLAPTVAAGPSPSSSVNLNAETTSFFRLFSLPHFLAQQEPATLYSHNGDFVQPAGSTAIRMLPQVTSAFAALNAPPVPLPNPLLLPPFPNEAATATQSLAMPPPSLGGATNKAELGRATWTFLHTLAAQFPEHPTKQQQRDAKQLLELMTRIYPCADCAKHFHEIVKRDPPVVTSGQDLQRWMCRVHNTVNRSIGKPTFNCDLVSARWAPLDCTDDTASGPPSGCDMSVGLPRRR